MQTNYKPTQLPTEKESDLPWQPLFTIERSGRKEVTVYGIICLVTGIESSSKVQSIATVKPLVQLGDINYQVWSRSVLKPWQLLQHLPILKRHFPQLKSEHLALFMASHSAEPRHLELLEEIVAITGANEADLKCPPAAPMSSETKSLIGVGEEKARRRFHNCSGKHIGYLSAIKASGGDPEKYLQADQPQHVRLRKVLSALIKRSEESLLSTTDGCQLPNYALSVFEMAYLYQSLLSKTAVAFDDSQIEECAEYYHELGQLILAHPRAISGEGRVDFRLITQDLFGACEVPIVAKEGADGLLGVGIGSCEKYPHGLGLCIKLSSGFDNRHMELILREVLKKLKLIGPRPEKRRTPREIKIDHIKTYFHFDVSSHL
ncbi:MAG: asparaginase [Candidatus Melainabacteria bacterium]|nr:asparaginase [Candidatus Melainabacteria bacterium]